MRVSIFGTRFLRWKNEGNLDDIRPQWCEKIFNGSKTIEVRKSRPSIDMPFTVYVYQTKIKGKKGDSFMVVDALNENLGCGKVIGSFVCDRIREIIPLGLRGFKLGAEWLKEMCLSKEQLDEYGGLKTLYSWHITEPKLFDKPRDITEFVLYGKCAEDCKDRMTCKYFKRTFLKRPPMSWYYIEADEN